ncbi:MAG: FAA hydrolase family protein [Dehalococcoidia bacterium]|nr:FAA hydrolase family protein [Dehalococcoidia bacterium]
MKLALYNDHRPGLLKGDAVVDISDTVKGVAGRNGQETMEGIISNFESLRPALQAQLDSGKATPLSQVKLRSPLPRPGKIMMMGTNYLEFTGGAPFPIFGFLKSPEAILDTGGTIELPPDNFVICHHEAEFGVVVGKKGHRISEANAFDHIFGYTCCVDVSARYFPDLANTLLGKSYMGFHPLGPCILTKDEVPDPYALKIQLWVNGELRQDFGNDDMGHKIPECIAYFSARTMLNPGDVFSLGTNHQGLGALQDGDHVEMEITKIGRITFDITDPLKRSWPKGIDRSIGENVKTRLLAHQAELAAKK